MIKNNNSTSKIVDEKISCDNSIKGKLLRTFNTVNHEIIAVMLLKITINRYL